MAAATIDRAVSHAVKVRPVRVLLWVVALPFLLIGAAAGLFVAVVLYGWGAVRVGFEDGRALLRRPPGDSR